MSGTPYQPAPESAGSSAQPYRLMRMFCAIEVFLVLAASHRLIMGQPEDAVVILGAAVLLTLTPLLAKRQYHELATGWLLYLLTVLMVYFLWMGDGLRDEAVLGYPAILVISSIIATWRVFLSLLGAMIASMLVVGLADTLGWHVVEVTPGSIDVAILMGMILIITAYCIRLLMDDIRRLVSGLRTEIVSHQASREHIDQLIHHDALTGLPNRVLLTDRFEQMYKSSSRDGTCVALLFIDLDNFKTINDSLGHTVGDEYLKAVAGRLKNSLRSNDTLCRFGGDEFVVLLGEIKSSSSTAPLADTLLGKLSEPILIEGHELTTTASIGIAIAPYDGTEFADLLRKADMAMYESKKTGRNGLRLYHTGLNRDAQMHARLIADLRKAIDSEQFSLYFQPKVNLHTGALVGCEALLRWRHPTLGLIPPDTFIPLAERSGLIVNIGNWVIEQACRAIGRLDKVGFGNMTMAINVSALQLRREGLLTTLRKSLTETSVAACRLELEITESSLIDVNSDLASCLSELRSLGMSLSIDDFGTGYSNLGHLKKLEVSALKIDRSFVSRLNMGDPERAIVLAIIQMSTSLKLQTVAEGVENKEEAETLKELGCTLGQGYYWGKPMPEAAFAQYISTRALLVCGEAPKLSGPAAYREV